MDDTADGESRATGAVLFDLDDTLYPYPPCNEAGKRAAFERGRELGHELSRAEFDALYQRGRRDVKRDLDGTAASHERYLYFKRGLELPAESGERAGVRASDALALGEAYWNAYLDEMALFPDVEETLSALSDAGLKVGVVTNLTTSIQLRKVDRLGIEDVLDVLVTSEEVGWEKPGSVPFTYALARLGVSPESAVMVGDNVKADVFGANALGIETVLWNADDADPGDESEASGATVSEDSVPDGLFPDHRIEAFDELTEVVL